MGFDRVRITREEILRVILDIAGHAARKCHLQGCTCGDSIGD